MFIKNDCVSKKSCFCISLQNENESRTVNSLMLYSSRIDTRIFGRYGESTVDKIGGNFDTSLVTRLNL